MCGRYTWKKTHNGQFRKLVKDPATPAVPSFNRAPGQSHPAITLNCGSPTWKEMRWGYPKTEQGSGFFPINARSETVAEKPIFRQSFLEKRCLIPADGWFEWQVIEGQKYPHYIFSERNEVFAFAGIWTSGKETESGSSFFSVLTRSAASNILHIHHRAPLALTEKHWENWLKQDIDVQALITQTQCGQPRWSATQVSSRVNSTRNNDSSLLEPYSGKQSLLF